MNLQIIILAAGKGKRMNSSLPKVLHLLAGQPMLMHVLQKAKALKPSAIHVIYGHEGQAIRNAFPDLAIHWVEQKEQLGTGHAVQQVLSDLPDESKVLILSADVPLIGSETLQAVLDAAQESALVLLVAKVEDAHGLGRIVRNSEGELCAIREEKDASSAEKQIQEIYSGICCVDATALKRWLPQLKTNNTQQEYYLTDIVALALGEDIPVKTLQTHDAIEVQGVNTRLQLQKLERAWQQRKAEALLLEGVGIADANRIDVRGELQCGRDVWIDVGCVFEGKVTLEDGVVLAPYVVLKNTQVGKNTRVHAHSVMEETVLGPNCEIGPFARLRPGTHLAAHCRVGNFVETKKAKFGEGSKANHLSYLGDVEIGQGVNIGAGTITCNYDGAKKHQTIIEDHVFIGSDTQLVAPVRVGINATIGAGSTIRKDVPAEALTLTESKQKTVYGWKRPQKES